MDQHFQATNHFPLRIAVDCSQHHRQFFLFNFFGGERLRIKMRTAESRTKYANHCAVLPSERVNLCLVDRKAKGSLRRPLKTIRRNIIVEPGPCFNLDPPLQVSLDSRVREIINRNMIAPSQHTFDEAQLQIYTLMHRDSYPRFVNSPVYRNLIRTKHETPVHSN